MSGSVKSQVTDIEYLSKTRGTFKNVLSFAGRGLKLNTREEAKEIHDAILNFKNLEVLILEGNTFSPEAADEISKALEKHPELQRFIANDIFTGRLKDEIPLALKSICGAIDSCGTHLVELNMSDNAYGPIGLDALVNFFQSGCCFSLKEIRMHNNGLGPQGAQKFANALQQCYVKSNKKFALKVFICGRNRLEYEGAKAISATLKQIGTLEEIQMPQNGIRPNGIEFIAEALVANPNLRILNLNDNTMTKIGSEWISKALGNLRNLEYLNLGDCLLKSKGAVLIARSISELKNLKEVILSFNEIDYNAGMEISKILVNHKNTLKLLDLNGNKFGQDGVVDIRQILEPVKNALNTLSEDEGSDEEEDEVDEDENDEEDEEEEDEEENSEVVVDDGQYDDYDQVENEDYNEDEDYDEDEDDEDEDEEYGENNNQNNLEQKFGSFNIVQNNSQPQSLFSNFQFGKPNFNPPAQNAQSFIPPSNNLFSNMVKNTRLITNLQSFDAFIINPNITTLQGIDDNTLYNVTKHEKFTSSFLLRFLAHLSKVYEPNSPNINIILKVANFLTSAYFQKKENVDSFSDEFLTELGFLKSEEKNFQPIETSDKFYALIQVISKQSYFPGTIKQNIITYLNLRNSSMTGASFNPTFKKHSDTLIRSLS